MNLSAPKVKPLADDSQATTDETADGAVSEFAQHVSRRTPPEGESTPLLECEDFSVFYGANQAVKNLTTQIPRSEVTAIIGPSGCGKSTFLNAINRMTDLIPGCTTTGTMKLNGDDVYGPDTDVVWLRRRIGMVFQKPNPFPKSIFANVAYGPKLHGLVTTRAELSEVVERSLRGAALWDEVKDRLDTNALGLSGGQQQRLCIARSLAVDPDVILFDEPTSALDPGSTSKIEDLMESLRGSYTVVIVTHNMQQASRISDYTMFFYKGDLIEFGRTADLFIKPQQEKTQQYITGSFG